MDAVQAMYLVADARSRLGGLFASRTRARHERSVTVAAIPQTDRHDHFHRQAHRPMRPLEESCRIQKDFPARVKKTPG